MLEFALGFGKPFVHMNNLADRQIGNSCFFLRFMAETILESFAFFEPSTDGLPPLVFFYD